MGPEAGAGLPIGVRIASTQVVMGFIDILPPSLSSTHQILSGTPVHHRTCTRIHQAILPCSITRHTSKGTATFLRPIIFTIKTSPPLPLQRTKIKTLGHPGRVLNGRRYMDPIIHSVANATPNRCLKSTPSLTHTAHFLLMT